MVHTLATSCTRIKQIPKENSYLYPLILPIHFLYFSRISERGNSSSLLEITMKQKWKKISPLIHVLSDFRSINEHLKLILRTSISALLKKNSGKFPHQGVCFSSVRILESKQPTAFPFLPWLLGSSDINAMFT